MFIFSFVMFYVFPHALFVFVTFIYITLRLYCIEMILQT